MFLRVLFVSAATSHDHSAYTHRLLTLKEGLEESGVLTKILYIGDYSFKSPSLIKALNIPLLQSRIDGYDVIHGGASSACYVLGIMKHLKDFILINDVHGSIEESRLITKNRFDIVGHCNFFQSLIMMRTANRYSDFFITCSGPLKHRLIHEGIHENRLEIVRNGVDTDLFKPKNTSTNDDNFVVTYAGGFQRWQCTENLVEAAKLIKDANIKFKIIGFEREDQVLKEKFKRILGDRAELIDALPRNELVGQLCSSDVLIIPRNRHPALEMAFPTKFAEYLAIGKPVIVTNVDETASFVKKYDCGFVCESYVESIAKTIIQAKESPSSKLLDMGKNGRRLAESQFDQRMVGKQYFEFLRRVLSNS